MARMSSPETLSSSFYEKVVGSVASNFADLVIVGERIEPGLKRGQTAQTNSHTSSSRKPVQERRKRETNAITIDPSKSYGQERNSGPQQVTLGQLGMVVSTDSPTQNEAEATGTPNAQNTRPV
ncbi:hypothetical protein CR513_37743, partial [Mucuna pruriens]